MKEILAWNEIDTIEDVSIKKYMLRTKQRATEQQKPWDFKNWGYWVIIDRWSELEKPLIGTHFTLPSISQGLLNHLEIFEEHNGVCEMVYLLNNDFGISLVMKESVIPYFEKQALEDFKSFSIETSIKNTFNLSS